MLERIRCFLESVREFGVIGAIKFAIAERIKRVKEFLGYSELEYAFSNNNINEIIDYTEEKEEHEETAKPSVSDRFKMNPIA